MGRSRRSSYDLEHGPVINIHTYDSSMAKQQASIAWIVQKAHKNKVPADLQEPYYRDYESQEHLKPTIVHRLSNADLYCSALANIYSDPNFHNLSHWNIIQALARKGVYVAEPTDVALTETVLIQVTPIKISAHLAVIEAMMALYIREVVEAERVVLALQRVGGQRMDGNKGPPQDQEEALVQWVSQVTLALQHRIHDQLSQSQDQEFPVFPHIQDLSDLSDGIGLAALISYYCPHELSWGDIAVADPPSMADSLYNVGLVIRFCHESLPYNPCLLTKEDIVYMHSSVKQNILAFVAELFFLMELEPVSCVTMPSKKGVTKLSQLTSPAMKPAGAPSVKRSHSMNLNDMSDMRSRIETRSENAPSSYNSDYGGRDSSMSDGQEGDFVVQRSRGVPTLTDMMRNQSPRPTQDVDNYSVRSINSRDRYSTDKEKYNFDSKEEEMGERTKLSRKNSFHGSFQDVSTAPPAGIPTRTEERPKGRSRSRRNSINAEESQLTIENFGGSQDNLNYITRNPDKEIFVHTGRRDSGVVRDSGHGRDSGVVRDSGHGRDSGVVRDGGHGRDSFVLGDSVHDRDSRETSLQPESRNNRERSVERRLQMHRPSMDELDNRVIDKLEREAFEREKRDLSHYSSKELLLIKDNRKVSVEQIDSGSESDLSSDREKLSKATSFAELSKLKEQIPLPGGINIIYMQSDKDDTGHKSSKSRGKKTTFAALPNQTTWKQQSVQSHSDDNKSVGDEPMEPQVMSSELHNVRLKLEEKRRRIESEKRKMELMMNKQRQKLGKEAFMQAVVKGDIGADVSNMSRRWLETDHGPVEELRTPELESMDFDDCHKSLTQMTDSLTEIQGDLQRLTSQQHQIQNIMHNGMPPTAQQQQFYLHDQQGSPVRRVWGQQTNPEGYATMSPASRRAQWGPARPAMGQGGDYMMTGTGSHPIPPPHPSSQQQYPGYYPPYPVAHANQQLPPINQINPVGQIPPSATSGFMLHNQPQSLPTSNPASTMYQNGQNYYSPEHQYRYPNLPPNYTTGTPQQKEMGGQPSSHAPFRLHSEGPSGGGDDGRGSGSLRSSAHSSPSRQILPQQFNTSQPQLFNNSQPQPQPQQFNTSQPQPQQFNTSQPQPQPQQFNTSQPQPQQFNTSQPQPQQFNNSQPQQFNTPQSQQMVPSRQQKSPSPSRQSSVHAPVTAPPADDMEPQSVYFIDSQQEQINAGNASINEKLKRLTISSGNRTYRISHEPGSPTRPSIGTKTFRVPTKKGTPVHDDADLPQPTMHNRSFSPEYHPDEDEDEDDDVKTEPLQDGTSTDKGFYISFDEETIVPRKPKPPLRIKKVTRKGSTPTTPLSTPSREELPFLSDRPSNRSNGRLDLSLTRGHGGSSFHDGGSAHISSMSPTSPSSSLSYPLLASSSSPTLPKTNGFNNKTITNEECPESEDSEDLLPLHGIPLPSNKKLTDSPAGMALVIQDDALDQQNSMSDMEKKKEKLMMMAMKRKQQQEEARRKKEIEGEVKREEVKTKEDEKFRKKEEERARREIILERHKIKKAIEEAEKEGRHYQPPPGYLLDQQNNSSSGKQSVRMRKAVSGSKPRPRTMHVASYPDSPDSKLPASQGKRGSSTNVAREVSGSSSSGGRTMRKSSGHWGSSHSLSRAGGSRGSANSLTGGDYPPTTSRTLERGHTGRRPTSVIGSTSSLLSKEHSKSSQYGLAERRPYNDQDDNYHVHETRRPSVAATMGSNGPPILRRSSAHQGSRGSTKRSPRKFRSTGNLSGQSEHDSLGYHMSEDSGLGRATPPRRAQSPGMASRHLPSPSGPGSLPPGLFSRRRPGAFDDAASDISSTASSTWDYCGPKLFKQPTSKSNRSITLNAVEYCVFPGVVNHTAKHRVLEEVARSEAKHFLILFRDVGCQFRALYSFNPETEEVFKLYGTGPKQVNERMYEKFFKYNSGGKCFSQIHTKHLTVTIDAFTIHNSLWQGKKVNLPLKKDMTLVI